MQRATECDMVLIHDDDLVTIDELNHGAVSGHLIGSRIVLLMLEVTGNP
jgi:hypothetical protein